MKKCSVCMTENPDSAKFCKSCGSPFDEAGNATPGGAAVTGANANSKPIVWGILALIVVAVLGFGIYYYFSHKPNNGDSGMLGLFQEDQAEEESTEENSFPYEEFTIGIKGSVYPYFYTGKDGNETGLEVELLNAAGEHENFSWSYEVYSSLEECMNALEDDSIDGVLSTVPISDSYGDNIIFSHSYIFSGIVLVVPTDSSIEGFENLNGQKVAVVKNQTTASIYDYALSLQSQYGFEVVPFETVDEAYASIENGECAGLLDDFTNYRAMVKEGKDVKKVGDLQQRTEYGLAVNDDNPKSLDLLDRFDIYLQVGEITGDLGRQYQKHINYIPWEEYQSESESD